MGGVTSEWCEKAPVLLSQVWICSKPRKSPEKAWSYFGRPEALTNAGGEYAHVDWNSSDAIFSPSKTGRTGRTIATGPEQPK